MRVIFLDFDGVINGYELWREIDNFYLQLGERGHHLYYMSHTCVRPLNRLFKLLVELNYKIVVSSAWRIGNNVDDFNNCFMEISGIFNARSEKIFIGKTGSNKNRGLEIQDYLFQNKIEDFLIIDDEVTANITNTFSKEKIYQVNGKIGLTDDDIDNIERILRNRE